MKPKPTPENAFTLPKYRDIINLLFEFQGLQQKHFRYALIENHDKMEWYNENKVLKTFGGEDKLQSLIDSGRINPKCISSGKNLHNFLVSLVDIGVIKKDKGSKITKYRLEKTYRYEVIKGIIQQNISYFNKKEVIDFMRGDKPIGVLLGIDIREIYEHLTDTEKKEVRLKIKEIDKILLEIDKIFSTRMALSHFQLLEDNEGKLPERERIEKEEVLKNIDEGLLLDTLTFVRQPFYALLKDKKALEKENKNKDEIDRMMDIQIKAEKNKKIKRRGKII
jgi:hypothetical protein